jgi:hypothetical protein
MVKWIAQMSAQQINNVSIAAQLDELLASKESRQEIPRQVVISAPEPKILSGGTIMSTTQPLGAQYDLENSVAALRGETVRPKRAPRKTVTREQYVAAKPPAGKSSTAKVAKKPVKARG